MWDGLHINGERFGRMYVEKAQLEPGSVPFYSGKTINLKRSIPFVVLLLFVLGFALLSIHPPLVLFVCFVAYGLSGYVYWAWRWMRRRRSRISAPAGASRATASPSRWI